MIPVNITFRHMPVSPALSDKVRQRARKLERFYNGIIKCDVVIEAPPYKHERQAHVFSVRISLGVPGDDLIVHEAPAKHAGDDTSHEEDVYVTVNKAFHKLRRRLEDWARIRHGKVKRHSMAPEPPVPDINEEDYNHEPAR